MKKRYAIIHTIFCEVEHEIIAKSKSEAILKAEREIGKEFPGFFDNLESCKEVESFIDVNGHGE